MGKFIPKRKQKRNIVSTYLNDKDYNKLRKLADRYSLNVAAFIRKFLLEHLKREQLKRE